MLREKARRAAAKSKQAHPARDRFTAFKCAIYRRYQHPPHLAMLDNVLVECTRHAETDGAEGVGHLLIQMPPRHGKTLTTSRYFPAWHLGRNPDHRVIMASYAADLAEKNSRVARNLLSAPIYQRIFPGVALARDSHAVNAWDIAEHEGGCDAVGVGGGVAGKGGNLIIVDDPIKNREEAESATYRRKIWEWFNDDLYTRREPGAAVILIMTRWHRDDLAGRLLAQDVAKWTVLCLPALAEENDLLEREIGEALWPERFPVQELANIQKQLGPYGFSSEYQQRPAPREGGLFQWDDIHRHRTDEPPDLRTIVVAIDPAAKKKRTSDYTGIVVAGRGIDNHAYVLADLSLRASPDRWGRAAVTAYQRYQANKIVAEINNGGDMVENVIRTVPDGMNVPYETVTATRGKAIRAEPVASLYRLGKVHHVGEFPELEDQLCTWTEGDDSPDRLDALVWAISALGLTEPTREWSGGWA